MMIVVTRRVLDITCDNHKHRKVNYKEEPTYYYWTLYDNRLTHICHSEYGWKSAKTAENAARKFCTLLGVKVKIKVSK